MATRNLGPERPESIPFYRNVKIIGTLVQIVFVLLVGFGIYILYDNVTTRLTTSNLPADFSFLDERAGVPIGETTIPYTTNDSYWRALLVGILNTLNVAVIGIILTSILGVVIGVMRLSTNWLLRQIATVYVEVIRNTPLAVQLIFWYYAVLLAVPPRVSNPIELPGNIFFSQVGIAFPWLFPSYNFSLWLPWLVVAAILFGGLFVYRRTQIERSERSGRAWTWPLVVALAVAGLGYGVASWQSSLPEAIDAEFLADRGRGTIFLDRNGDGKFGDGERGLARAVATVAVAQGQLSTTSQDLTESGEVVYGTFRFAILEEHEYSSASVDFVDPSAAEELSLHFLRGPSIGTVYRDRNNNGVYDPGEELRDTAEGASPSGFSGIRLTLSVTDFERRVVSSRDGSFRVPIFTVAGAEDDSTTGGGTGGGLGGLFGPPGGTDDAESALDTSVTHQVALPLVLSVPTIPRSDYVGGVRLSEAFLALLFGLVIYTASFIAEIVRGGIQAVPNGQREAANALGLGSYQTFSLIVFPQAVRIILPPMISQYLNLTKNSSLAILVTFADFFQISNIIANQTGAAVPMYLIIIVGYLIISLTFAFILNIVNERMALVER
ncbi:MAG: ABC transporter permease subunit [Trueperaceae bacterium]|nr:ABC transporter permease subunit [Trueperaceae bacterium]